ncbi:MAG: hypothetical protein QOI76_2162 [Frankiales bacterium]|nr:hypothetical protein [Frankiales bacterium]
MWARLSELPGVAEAMAEARVMVDRVLVHRVLRTRTAALAAESALRGARASAALEGSDVPLDQARSAAQTDPVLAGALRVHAELPRLRTVWRSSPRQALARLHLLAAADLTGPGLLGRPVDADAAGVVGRVAALAVGRTAAPALLVAAVVHGELASANVFSGGNGVVARAASRLILADRGLDPGLLCAPEVGHLEVGDYAEALASYGRGDPEPWLRHCAAAALAGAREALAVAEAMVRG